MPAISRQLSLKLLRVSALALSAALGMPAAYAADVVINGTTEDSPPFAMSLTDNLIVGTDGTGVLNVLSGSVFTNSTVLGREATGNGTINVTAGGFGGPTSPLTIGLEGTGTVSAIAAGNIYIYSQVTTLGALAGSTGTATLSGANAEWNVLGNLTIGAAGTGTFNLLDGALLNHVTGNTIVGASTGGEGTFIIDNTTFTTADLTVGGSGTGTMTVSNGANLTSDNGYVGYSGGTGTASISGAGSLWTLNGSLTIGYDDNATGIVNVTDGATLDLGSNYITVSYYDAAGFFNVSGGSTVTSGAAYFGYYSDTGVGVANISGAGTTWTVDGEMRIGDEGGAGELNITEGAHVSVSGEVRMGGYDEGVTRGDLLISGAGSEMAVGGTAYIGYERPAIVTVSNGGRFEVTGDTIISYDDTAAAEVTITGAGSQFIANNVHIGYYTDAVATVNITDGASADTGSVYVGSAAGSTGTVNVSGAGSTWTSPSDITVGNYGYGVLNVLAGGQVTADGVSVGYQDASPGGEVNIDGPGSKLTSTGAFELGYQSTGTMNVTNGAVLDVRDGVDGQDFYVGYYADAEFNVSGGSTIYSGDVNVGYCYACGTSPLGVANISGAGTTWTIDGEMFVANEGGRGQLNISGGAIVSTTDGLTVAYYDNSPGAVNISGAGSQLNIGGDAVIGYEGNGTAVISNGGVFSVAGGTEVSKASTSVASITVTGPGSQFTSNGVSLGTASGANGTLIVANGALANTGALTLAPDANATGRLVIGAVAGEPAVAAGTLNASTVTFGPGSGEIVFNHTGNVNFTSALTGGLSTGEISVLAGTTTFSTDSAGFLGDATVSGGKAVFNADYSSTDVEVSGSGVVGGDGTVQSLNVLSGGTVAPGNSPGTIHVFEGVTFASGSKYAVEVAGTQSDLISAGTATLNGGTVQVSGTPSLMRYAILTTTFLPVTGTFDGLESSSAFILYSLDYDLNNVYLVVDGYKSLTTVARTPNQYAVANALDKFPKDNPLYSAVVSGSVADAQQAFNALSGEVHASVGTALADDSRYVREAITGRLIQAYYGGASAGGGQPIVMAAAAPTDVVEMDSSSRMSLGAGYASSREAAPSSGHDLAWWSRAFGAWGEYNTNNNAATTDRNLGGFITGVDGGLGGGWRGGLATGYLNTNLSVDDRWSSAQINSYVLGAYAGGGIGDFAFRSGGTWTWNSIDSSRNVIFPGFSEFEGASYNGDVGQLFAELAYPVFTHGGVIEPFAGLAYVHVGTDGFTESGAVAGLTSGGLDMNVGYGTLGARTGTTVVWGATTVIPHASLAWQYAFGDTTPEQALAFASTGIGMGIGGVPLAQNSALVEVGADAVIAQDATLGISYIGQYSGDFTDTGLRGRFNWKF